MIFSLLILVLLLPGCDKNPEKSVTDAFFYRSHGELKSIKLSPDSVTIGNVFHYNVGENALMLAGRYNNLTAFSLFKFSLGQIAIDSLKSVSFKVGIEKVWEKGNFEFELHETISDWSDSSSLSPDRFLTGLGIPLSTISDTSSTISMLSFDMDTETIVSWSDEVNLLVKNTDTGMAMASLLSEDRTP